MKRIVSVILVCCLLVMNCICFAEDVNNTETLEFAGGTGIESDPYQVATPEQLNAVRNYLDAYFIQTCDIDMTQATAEGGIYYNDGKGWSPIGDSSTPFTGTYNGGNFAIKGLFCADDSDYVGIFGYSKGILRNIKAQSCYINAAAYVGSVVGYSNGTVECCYNNSNVTGEYAGGIAGFSDDVTNSCNEGTVVGNTYIGGIVGSGNVTNSCNKGTVTGTGYIGGIVGSGTAKSSFNIGNISSLTTTNAVGGIVGIVSGGTYIKEVVCDCYNKGTVSGGYYTAGIVGTAKNPFGERITTVKAKIINCYNTYALSKNIYGGGPSNISVAQDNSYFISEDLTLNEMKNKETYIGFDFDTIWDIKDGINEGFPYLRWIFDYIIESFDVVNNIGEPVKKIDSMCYAKICLTKNSIKSSDDCIMLAMYDDYNKFLGLTHIKINMSSGQNITLNIPIPNPNTDKLKVFVWDEISTMKPLSNVGIY